jgi:drug/metabolite transporter (DMT)-like permease
LVRPGDEARPAERGPSREGPLPRRVPAAPALIAAALVFALMAIVAKQASARLPGPQVAFVRFLVGIAAWGAASLRVPMRARNKLGLFLRGVYGGAAVLLYFLAIAHLPVGIATLLNYTAPVFTAVYAATVLGEAVTTATLAALALTTVGVVLVIVGTAPPGSLGFGPWQLVGVGSAMLSGAAVATIRQVRKTDGSWEIFAAFCLAGALITGPPALVAWVRPRPVEWLQLVAVGLSSVVAQLLMTYALRYVRAAVAGVIAQLTPVASIALGWALFGERPAALALAGAAVTLAGVTVGTSFGAARAPDPAED